MNTKTKIYAFLTKVMMFFLIQGSFGQDIDHLYQELENNATLKALQLDFEAKIAGADQFNRLPDPEFSAGVFPLPVETRLGAQLFRISIMQMIPNKNISKQKKMIEEAKALPVLDQRMLISINLKNTLKSNYLEYYRLQRKVSIMKKNLNYLDGLEAIATSKLETNQGKLSDLLRIQLRKQNFIDQIKILEQQTKIPLNNINAILFRSDTTALSIEKDLPFPEWGHSYAQLLAHWENNHPKLHALQHQKEILIKENELEFIAAKPIFGAGIDYIGVGARNVEDLAWNGRDIVQLKASLVVPLNKKPYEQRTKARLIQMESIDYQREQAVREIQKTFENARDLFETSKLSFDLAQNQISLLESTLAVLEEEYAAGKSNVDAIISTGMEIISYDLSALESIISAYKAINTLENLIIQ